MTHLENIFKLVEKKRKSILILLVLSALICSPALFKLRIHTDVSAILPPSLAPAKTMQRVMRDYPAANPGFLILIKGSDENDCRKTLKEFKNSVSARIPDLRIIAGTDTSFIKKYGLWLADTAFVNSFCSNIKGSSPSQLLAAINSVLEEGAFSADNAAFSAGKEALVKNLIRFLNLASGSTDSIVDNVKESAENILNEGEGLQSADGRSLLVGASFNDVNKDHSAAGKSLRSIADSLSGSGISVLLTGTSMLAFEESESVMKDVRTNAVGTIVMVLLFLLIAYRKIRLVVIIIMPVVIGLIFNAALVYLFANGQIHIVSAAFIMLMIGLGTDLPIQFIEAVRSSQDRHKALAAKAVPLFIAVASTALVFACLAFSGVGPLVQLGWIVPSGILITFVLSAISVPCLLPYKEPVEEKNILGVKNINGWKSSYKFTTLLLVFAGVAGAILLYRSPLERDFRKLSGSALPSFTAMKEVRKDFTANRADLYLLVGSQDSLQRIVNDLKKDPLVKRVLSPLDIMPDSIKMATVNNSLSELRSKGKLASPDGNRLLEEISRLRMNLTEISQLAFAGGDYRLNELLKRETSEGGTLYELEKRLNSGMYQRNLYLMDSAASGTFSNMFARMASAPPFTANELPFGLREQFFPGDTTVKGCIVQISLKRDPWEPSTIKRIQSYLSPQYPELTGVPLIAQLIIDHIVKRGIICIVLSFIVCGFTLFWFWRSIPRALSGLLPVAVAVMFSGYVFYAGAALGEPLLNYISISSLLLIVGTGLPYSLYSRNIPANERKSAQKANLMSALSSLAGYSGVAMCNHAGLQGFGLSLCAGLTICYVWSWLYLKMEGNQ